VSTKAMKLDKVLAFMRDNPTKSLSFLSTAIDIHIERFGLEGVCGPLDCISDYLAGLEDDTLEKIKECDDVEELEQEREEAEEELERIRSIKKSVDDAYSEAA